MKTVIQVIGVYLWFAMRLLSVIRVMTYEFCVIAGLKSQNWINSANVRPSDPKRHLNRVEESTLIVDSQALIYDSARSLSHFNGINLWLDNNDTFIQWIAIRDCALHCIDIAHIWLERCVCVCIYCSSLFPLCIWSCYFFLYTLVRLSLFCFVYFIDWLQSQSLFGQFDWGTVCS